MPFVSLQFYKLRRHIWRLLFVSLRVYNHSRHIWRLPIVTLQVYKRSRHIWRVKGPYVPVYLANSKHSIREYVFVSLAIVSTVRNIRYDIRFCIWNYLYSMNLQRTLSEYRYVFSSQKDEINFLVTISFSVFFVFFFSELKVLWN